MELCRPRHNSILFHASNLLNILRLNIAFVLIHGQMIQLFCLKSVAIAINFVANHGQQGFSFVANQWQVRLCCYVF